MHLCGNIFLVAIFSCEIFPASAAFGAEKVRGPAVVPLVQAHAHNDYRHARPLLDALDHGFCSVEADIFLVNGELLIGHHPIELTPRRTLEKLYLAPLRRRVQENGGRVFSGGPRITLLIDIKTNGSKTYQVLREALANYKEILSSVENGRRIDRAVDVVISGNRPWEDIAREKIRYAGIDGRLADLESSAPAHLLPLISDRWTSHFRWRGDGEISAAEREKLQSIVARAHHAGRRVRFWATPENSSLWKELAEQSVDHINTDDLAGLQTFFLQRLTKNNAATEQIKEVLAQQAAAWNAGDLERFMQHYWKSDDLTFSSGGKVTRGWSATKANYERRYNTPEKMGRLAFANLEISLLGSDSALVLGRWSLTRKAEPAGGAFSLVFRQLDGQWVIIHDHTSADGNIVARKEQAE